MCMEVFLESLNILSGHTACRQKEALAVVRKYQLFHYRSNGFKVPENIYCLFCYKFTENLMAKKTKLLGQHLGMLRVRIQWQICDSECMANGQLWRCRVENSVGSLARLTANQCIVC